MKVGDMEILNSGSMDRGNDMCSRHGVICNSNSNDYFFYSNSNGRF